MALSTPGQFGRVGVIGLGNVLMGDDAFGPYVVELLSARYEFPENVFVCDLGTPSLDLTAYITDADALVVVDAVHAPGRAGELRRYTREEILARPIQPRVSPHEPGLKEALLITEFGGRGPREVLLVGAVPETTSTGVGMSGPVRAAIPAAMEAVVEELRRLGAEVSERAAPPEPQIWWEETAAVLPPVVLPTV